METLTKPAASEQKYYGIEGIRQGCIKTIPVSFSVAIYGFLFSVLVGQAGLSFLEGALMSTFVFEWAPQLIVLDLWTQPLLVFTIIFTTFAINLRHILMGVSLHKCFSKLSTFQAYVCVSFMVDESWAITMIEMEKKDIKGSFLLCSGLLLFFSWLGNHCWNYGNHYFKLFS